MPFARGGMKKTAPSYRKYGSACTSRNSFEHGDGYDIIHNHFDYLPLTYSGLTSTPRS